MIDTIVLRIHNVREKYLNLIKELENYSKKGYITETADISFEDFMKVFKANKPKHTIQMLKSHNPNDFLLKTQHSEKTNNSNHYKISYWINIDRNFIELNFSIPKYKFGTNVLLFIKHIVDAGYVSTEIEENIKQSYRILTKFLIEFLDEQFLFTEVSPFDIEVHRIDLCFNQVFKTKGEALLYLEYQKRLKKKYAHEDEGVMRDYATSLMYVTKRYSAKIYHKGTEYAKHDIKEHLAYNKKKGIQYFKTDKIQKCADRMLRYEITFRNAYINYLHKTKLFRTKDPIFKKMRLSFALVEMAKQKNERISKKIGSLKTQIEKDTYRAKHPYSFPSKIDKEFHKEFSKIISKRRYFMLMVNYDALLFNRQSGGSENPLALFSRPLLELMFKKLMEFVNEFQIKEMPTEEIVRKKIEQYNQTSGTSKLPIADMMSFYPHLLKHGSFKEAVKFCNLSRATLYRYMERFEKIGINNKSIKPIESSFGIPEAPLDLSAYHWMMQMEYGIIHGLKVNNPYTETNSKYKF